MYNVVEIVGKRVKEMHDFSVLSACFYSLNSIQCDRVKFLFFILFAYMGIISSAVVDMID